jgi:predicted DNA-binding protein
MKSSFRISEQLRLRLDRTARHLGKGKNWIMNRALEEYLTKTGQEALAAEAKRQSIVASGVIREDEKSWQKRADSTGWK